MSGYFLCPHCEAKVPANARACPACGSDENTGWSRDPLAADLGPGYDQDLAAGASTPSPWRNYLLLAIALLSSAAFLITTIQTPVALVPVALLFIGAIYLMLRKPPEHRPSEEQQLYQRLLQRAGGDGELVTRLIEYERKRNPSGTRREHMRDALYRWNRDRM